MDIPASDTSFKPSAPRYTSQLPPSDCDARHIRAADIWGSATPQIFGSVSPQMHEEFGITYEIEWLKRFGMTYYGCCEPLHNKIPVLRKIPNLRKLTPGSASRTSRLSTKWTTLIRQSAMGGRSA